MSACGACGAGRVSHAGPRHCSGLELRGAETSSLQTRCLSTPPECGIGELGARGGVRAGRGLERVCVQGATTSRAGLVGPGETQIQTHRSVTAGGAALTRSRVDQCPGIKGCWNALSETRACVGTLLMNLPGRLLHECEGAGLRQVVQHACICNLQGAGRLGRFLHIARRFG